MNERKLMQLCIGSRGACNIRLSTGTHLWSSCWHAALLYSITPLDGEMSSGAYAAVFAPAERSLKYHSQPVIYGVLVRVQRFCVGVLSRTAEISSLLYPSWSSFLTKVLQGIWPVTRLLLSLTDAPPTKNSTISPISSLTHPLCFLPNVWFWPVERNYLARSWWQATVDRSI